MRKKLGNNIKRTGFLQRLRWSRNGQSITEYAILLAIMAAALIAMQVYVKRGIQGRIRNLADQVSPVQYEPGQTTSNFTTTQAGKTITSYVGGSPGTSETSTDENVTRQGGETVEPETYNVR